MEKIGLSDIQKNISLFSGIKEPFRVVDKRKKINLAVVYPSRHNNKLGNMAGKYKNKIPPKLIGFPVDKAVNMAMEEVLTQKHGKSD